MPPPEHRQNHRLACSVPARVVVPSIWPQVDVTDLSRTGVRLEMRMRDLEIDPRARLGEIASSLRYLLQMKVQLEFQPPRSEHRVRRALKVVRIARSDARELHVELGCMMVPPLGDLEADMLGLPLPRSGERVEVARRRAALSLLSGTPDRITARPTPGEPPVQSEPATPQPPVTDVDGPAFDASLISRRPAGERTLRGRTCALDPEGGLLCLQEGDAGTLAGMPQTIADKVEAFDDACGAEVDVSIELDSRYLFYGPVRLTSVEEVPGLPGLLYVGFAFGRSLADQERRALAIA